MEAGKQALESKDFQSCLPIVARHDCGRAVARLLDEDPMTDRSNFPAVGSRIGHPAALAGDARLSPLEAGTDWGDFADWVPVSES